MKNKTVTAEISVEIPIIKDLVYEGFVPNLGALTLTLGERNFVLDSMNTDFDNEQEAGGTLSFTTRLEVDTCIFEEGEFVNYNLTEKDLEDENLKAEFFCGLEDAGEDEESLDMDNATIECTVTVDGKDYVISNVTFE
jgi:hypothetical protein